MDEDALRNGLLDCIQFRAENLFLTDQLKCAEAVLVVLNQGLGGDLPRELAIRLASGLPEGLGQRGCLCGALNGGALALGLFLGRKGPGYRNGLKIRRAVGDLHDRFKTAYKATCCRVLTQALDYGSKAHFRQCARITGRSARWAAAIVLDHRPELMGRAGWKFLQQNDRRVMVGVRKLIGAIGHNA